MLDFFRGAIRRNADPEKDKLAVQAFDYVHEKANIWLAENGMEQMEKPSLFINGA